MFRDRRWNALVVECSGMGGAGGGMFCRHSPVGHDALGDLADEDEEEDEGEDPAQVVSREVQPCAVMDVNLGTLTAPTCNTNTPEGAIHHQHREINTPPPPPQSHTTEEGTNPGVLF